MSRFHPSTSYGPSGIADSSSHDPGRADLPRHDRDPSPSDSESSSAFNAFPDTTTDDHPSPDDPYHALTSQTLNADGTPKRPMNAFMIFARKRRPQISAANQMMRTGDVSKILSKEWNSMEMSEKKFYLDQAKKLKDNFNSKYPDYVYRRRPNNSRKKRKPEPNHDDPSGGGADAPLGDPDDPAYDDPSPIDADDALMVPSPQDVQYTRSSAPHALNPSPPLYQPHHGAHDALGPTSPSAAACTYPYSSDFHSAHPHPSSRLLGAHPDASGLGSSIGPIRTSSLADVSLGSGAASGSSSSGAGGGGGAQGYQSLYQNANANQALYGTAHHAHAHGLWEPSRAGSRAAAPDSNAGAGARPNWPILPALDISLARQRSIPSIPGALGGPSSALHHSHQSHQHQHQHQHPPPHAQNGQGHAHRKSDAYGPGSVGSPQVPARPWSSATSSSSSSASATGVGVGVGVAVNAFPTLNSAFFPNESPVSKAMELASPGPGGGGHDYFASAAATATGLAGAGAGRRPSHTEGGYGGPYASQTWSQQYGRAQQQQQQQQQHQQQQQQRVSGMHAISPYSLQGSPEGSARSASTGSAHSAAQLGYWEDRFGGR